MGRRWAMAVVGLVAVSICLALGTAALSDTIVVRLVAGKHIDAGMVTVSNDGVNLYVTYSTTGGWKLTETHLAVAKSLDDIPQTKNGNPIPGKFPYSTYHTPPVTEFTYVIPLAELDVAPGQTLYIAAHAVVKKYNEQGKVVAEETAWGEGPGFPGKNWAMYFMYKVQDVKDLRIPTTPVTMVLYWKWGGRLPVDIWFETTLSDVPDGYDILNGVHDGWCAEQSGNYISPDGHTQYRVMLYSSYDPDLPADLQDPDWDMVNYILNHKVGIAHDVQLAIWYFVGGVPGYPLTDAAQAMVDEALTYGEGFRPAHGQFMAVICDPNVQGLNPNILYRIQPTFIKVDP